MRSTWRMAYRVTCPDGSVLELGDVVEWYSPERHRDVPRPILASAAITKEQLEKRAEGKLWLRPVPVMHEGKLHILERRCITNREPGSRRTFRTVEEPKPHEVQKELFE